jgi:hypothetical protein
MTSHASSYRRGLAVAAAAMLGLGIAGSQSPAFARVSDAMTSSAAKVSLAAPLAQRGSTPNSAIVVADNRDNDHGNWNGNKGKGDGNGNSQGNNGNWNGNKSGNWDGNKSGNWNGNKSGNWNGNKSGNWNGNKSGNWNGNKNGNWNKGGNYGNNWNKGGDKRWSNNNHWNNNWNKGWNNRAYVRGWSNRPYYGEFFGGVVLGSLLAAAGAGVVPYSPDPELCWYWADPYMYRGYWDYCY